MKGFNFNCGNGEKLNMKENIFQFVKSFWTHESPLEEIINFLRCIISNISHLPTDWEIKKKEAAGQAGQSRHGLHHFNISRRRL